MSDLLDALHEVGEVLALEFGLLDGLLTGLRRLLQEMFQLDVLVVWLEYFEHLGLESVLHVVKTIVLLG